MPAPKLTFGVAHSPSTGKVMSGRTREGFLVGAQHDVTDSFLRALVSFCGASGTRVIDVDGVVYEVRVKAVRTRPAKGAKG